jgi:MFS transporter, NNP family, nitrate/nitrite transporter
MLHTERLAKRALIAATMAFAACFSIWTLYAVLGLGIRDRLALSTTEFGFLLAAPMLTGSLIRFPVGLLCERYSCRKLFVLQMILVLPTLFLMPVAESYAGFLVIGLIMGFSGVSFTIGIRYVTAWFEHRNQGFAMGVFGAGNAGAAVTFAIAPLIESYWGSDYVGPFYGVGLLVMIVLFVVIAPEDTRYMEKNRRQPLKYHFTPLCEIQVWRFSLYYYFVFGSFLALLMWLPHYYVKAYKLSLQDAMLLTLLFVTVSSMVRALGGWLADRYGGRTINWNVFWISLVCLFFLSYPPTSMQIHGVDRTVVLNIEINLWVFTALMLVIGVAQGFGRASVYKIIYDYYPNHMGSVGGTVAALGATGGFTLPVVFGLAVDWMGIHSACFMVLYGVLAGCMVVMYFAIQKENQNRRLAEAIAHNFLEND